MQFFVVALPLFNRTQATQPRLGQPEIEGFGRQRRHDCDLYEGASVLRIDAE